MLYPKTKVFPSFLSVNFNRLFSLRLKPGIRRRYLTQHSYSILSNF